MSSANHDEDSDVSEPDDTMTETTTTEVDAMRPIPDGGLQQSMPEWLRRPPAWRNLPRREEPASGDLPPEALAKPEKSLPEPDTSEIDPRSLVDVSDLPQWLQDLAARERPAPAEAVPVITERAVPDQEDIEMTDRETTPAPESTERSVPFEPLDKKIMDVPERETKTYGGGEPTKGMSPVLIGLLALVVLVVIAMLLIAIL